MNDEQLRESLSALMDGELPRARAARVLDRALADDELRESWRRHHLISAALSTQQSLMVVDDELASRVSAALDAEPLPLRPPASRVSRNVGLAAAASVAMVAVLVILNVTDKEATELPAAPLAALNSAAPADGINGATTVPVASVVVAQNTRDASEGSASALTRMTWNDARPAVEARLNAYLLEHNEYLADGVRGMLPYARVVGYDTRN